MTVLESEITQAKVGLVGLAVMGRNLAMNIERNGFSVAVWNRSPSAVDEFIGAVQGKKFLGAHSAQEFIQLLERPRKIILLVKAGEAVDWTIEQLKPYLEKGDIIIDGGNSFFLDTIRRERELQNNGISFIGCGVSGGEEGALWGPSLMPGGTREAYNQVALIFEAIAAKIKDDSCVTYIGPSGAGHFVKMVHNGIEYADMQLIAESYELLRRLLNLSASELADIFAEWNKGLLESFLIEITSEILQVVDKETGKPLVDLVLDRAGQKGTGKWTSREAFKVGVAVPAINSAVDARMMSSLKSERVEASKQLSDPPGFTLSMSKEEFINAVHDALYASKICAYAQGMAMIMSVSKEWGWNLDLCAISRIWKGGCIIRASLLNKIQKAYRENFQLPNLLLAREFKAWMVEHQMQWRQVVSSAVLAGIPIPAIAASLSYFDMYRTANLPLNLIQAQRDFFGSHTYQRIDKPEVGFIHTDWKSLINNNK